MLNSQFFTVIFLVIFENELIHYCSAVFVSPAASGLAAIAASCMLSAFRMPADLLMKFTSTSERVLPSSRGKGGSLLAPAVPLAFPLSRLSLALGDPLSRSLESEPEELRFSAFRRARRPLAPYFSCLEMGFRVIRLGFSLR